MSRPTRRQRHDAPVAQGLSGLPDALPAGGGSGPTVRVRRPGPDGRALAAGAGVLVTVAALSLLAFPVQREALRQLLPGGGPAPAVGLVALEDLARELEALDRDRELRAAQEERRLRDEARRDEVLDAELAEQVAEVEDLLAAGRIEEGLEALQRNVERLPPDGIAKRWFVERLAGPLRDAAERLGAPGGTSDVWLADPSTAGDVAVLTDPGAVVVGALVALESLIGSRSALETFDEVRSRAERIASDGDRATYLILARDRLRDAADDLPLARERLDRWLAELLVGIEQVEQVEEVEEVDEG